MEQTSLEELHMDPTEGDIFIDGSCFGGAGRIPAAGLALAQLVIGSEGEYQKWKVYQESA